jgi:hypothetical protein
MVETIELSEPESALVSDIVWELGGLKDQKAVLANLAKVAEVTEMLFARKAIPVVRVNYFLDPEMNVGGHGKSRKDVFESNGTKGTDIFRHPHFLKYLKYFLDGPDLPDPAIKQFCQILEDDDGTSGEVLDQVTAFVRKEVKRRSLDPKHAAEEFFKLAHEIERPELAEAVRSAAARVRLNG